jgi:hypothetical protein
VADQLVQQLVAGAGLATAARSVGLGERTVRRWRARAYSRRAADAPFVALERRIVSALSRSRESEPLPIDWQAAAAFLEGEYGERWGPVEPEPFDDLLGELD